MHYWYVGGTTIQSNTLYPLGSEYDADKYFRKKGFSINPAYVHILARAIRQYRPPKKGEWYLSGPQYTAYQASDDLSVPYPIAELVVVEKVEYYVVIEAIPTGGK